MTHQRRPNSAFSYCGRRPSNFAFVDNPTCGNCKRGANAVKHLRRPPKTHLRGEVGFTLCKRATKHALMVAEGERPTCRPCKGAAP